MKRYICVALGFLVGLSVGCNSGGKSRSVASTTGSTTSGTTGSVTTQTVVGWLPPVVLGKADDHYSLPKLDVAENGSAVAVWLGRKTAGNPPAHVVLAASFLPGQGWGGAQEISQSFDMGVGQPPMAVGMNASGFAVAAWPQLASLGTVWLGDDSRADRY